MNAPVSKLDGLRRQIRVNGWLWGCRAITGFVLQKVRSLFAAAALGAPGIDLGPGCSIHGVRFMRFGSGIRVHGHLWLEAITRYGTQDFSPEVVIGDRVSFSENVHITSVMRVTIGHDVLFGSNVYVSDHNHGGYGPAVHSDPAVAPAQRELHGGGAVIIEANAWIGDNANIVGPCTIGAGAVVAANSVVRGDVPARTIVAGAPARVIKQFDDEMRQWMKVDTA